VKSSLHWVPATCYHQQVRQTEGRRTKRREKESPCTINTDEKQLCNQSCSLRTLPGEEDLQLRHAVQSTHFHLPQTVVDWWSLRQPWWNQRPHTTQHTHWREGEKNSMWGQVQTLLNEIWWTHAVSKATHSTSDTVRARVGLRLTNTSTKCVKRLTTDLTSQHLQRTEGGSSPSVLVQ